MTLDVQDAIEAFFIDPRVVELCELLRTGDDLLDVIHLSENQHSDILAWLLDPREGHGQGDQILRDLLIGATTTARSTDLLDGRGRTSRFFSAWPPHAFAQRHLARHSLLANLELTQESG